eukprot:jgi/Botrbrau1/17124/Bobra.0157s0025.1
MRGFPNKGTVWQISRGLSCGTLPNKRGYRNTMPARLARSVTLRLYQSGSELRPTASPKYFTKFCLHKGSAAVTFKPIPPIWSDIDSGDFVIKRQGALQLEFASVMPGLGNRPGERRYAWQQKQIFTLSPLELGSLLVARDFGMADIYHDPNKGTGEEGQIRKVLSYKRLADNVNFALRLSVKADDKTLVFDVPISPGEHETVKLVGQYLIPYLLGMNMALGIPSESRPQSASVVSGFIPL